jgi:hypothetical protein
MLTLISRQVICSLLVPEGYHWIHFYPRRAGMKQANSATAINVTTTTT